MSPDLKLVKFFIAEFYNNNATEMAYLVSPTFSFTLNSDDRLNFEFFIQRMRFLNHSTKFEIDAPSSEDDKHFNSEFRLQIPNGEDGFITASGKVEIITKYELIQNINVSYHHSQDEYDQFQRLMKASQVAFL